MYLPITSVLRTAVIARCNIMYYVRHHVLNSAWALYGHLMKCIEIDMHRRKAGFLYRIAATSVNSSIKKKKLELARSYNELLDFECA